MKYVGFVLLVVGAFLVGTVFSSPSTCGAACDSKIVSISAPQFNKDLKEKPGTLLDIRTREEYSTGHIKNAVNIDYYQTKEFSDYLDGLDKDQPYYIYCRTGNRSGSALQLMQQKGFKNVTNLSGGIVAWETTELPLVR